MTTAKRRVQVGRRTTESLNKGLESARTAEAVVAVRKEMAEQFDAVRLKKEQEFAVLLTAEKVMAHDEGMVQGRDLEKQDYEAQLDESVNNRLCDNNRDHPWPVGVIIAGEQHRILQALAEWLIEYDQPGLNAQAFARRLGIQHIPMHLDAPSAVTFRNCEEPPKHIDRDQRGKQIQLESGDAKLPGFTEHWKYYLRQLDDKG